MRVATSVRFLSRPVWRAGGLFVYKMPEICGRDVDDDGISRRATELSRVLSYIDFNLPWNYNVVIHGVCACDRAVLDLHKYRVITLPCTPPRWRIAGTDCAVQPCDSYECLCTQSRQHVNCLACWVVTHTNTPHYESTCSECDCKKEE